MLFLPKATRARNSKSLYRLLYNRQKETRQSGKFVSISHTWLLRRVCVSSPLSFKAQLRPQQLDDLAHRLVDVAFLDASHKTLQQLHGEELPLLTKAGAHQGVCACQGWKKPQWSNGGSVSPPSHSPRSARALAARCSMTNKTSRAELCMIPTGSMHAV